MKRRLFAIAMTLAMALSLLPVTALAERTEDRTQSSVTVTDGSDQTNESLDEGTQTDTETPDAETEASTDETGTETTTDEDGQDDGITTEQKLTTEISNAEDGATITLAGDITLTKTLTIEKSITLDGAGYTISGTVESGTSFISVRTDGEFAMVDCKFVPTGNVTPNGFITIAAKGKVTVTGCTFGSEDMSGTYIYNGLEFSQDADYPVADGTTISDNIFYGNAFRHNGINLYRFEENATVEINDNKFIDLNWDTSNAIRFSNYSAASVTVNMDGNSYSEHGSEEASYKNWAAFFLFQNASSNGSGKNMTINVSNLDYQGTTEQLYVLYENISAETMPTVIGDSSVSDLYVVNYDEGMREAAFQAAVDGVYYPSLVSAVAAAQDGDTVRLLQNASGNGIGTFKDPKEGQIQAKSFTIDFANFTYTIDGEAVGSTGTETQAFHLEWAGANEDNHNVILKNGTITSAANNSSQIYMLVQNYCNLTLDNMVLDGSNLVDDDTYTYALSNNCGDVLIHNTTIKTPDGCFAFDSCDYSSYTGVTVTVEGDETNIQGKIELTNPNGGDNNAKIIITGGTFSVKPDDSYLGTGLAFIGGEDGPWTVRVADGMEADASSSGGTASADVGGSFVTDSEGNGEGVSTDNTTIQIDVTTGEGEGPSPATGVTTTNVNIAPESLTSVQKAEAITSVEIATDVGTLTVSKDAWDTITDNAKDKSVTLSVSQVQTANDNQPLVYELTAKAGETDVFAQGSSGTITVDVPYTAEDNAQVYVYYVGDDGAEAMTEVAVDTENDRLSWTVSHFSTYVVTQNENSKAFTVTGDDDTVTEYTDLKAVLDAIANDTINDDVVINLVQNSTHTVTDANYDIDQNVTINGANATIDVTVATTDDNTSIKNHHAFQVVGGHTLTLNGVTMNIQDGEKTEGGNTVGTYGLDIQYGSTLVLDDADLNISNVSNATISASGVGTTPGVFKVQNGSTLTATNIRGNFSNGGNWTIGSGSKLTIDTCTTHGLSASSVTVENGAAVAVSNVGYRGISINDAGGKLEIQSGGTVTVTNACQAEGYNSSAVVMSDNATGGLQVAQGGKLTVTGENSEIQLSDAAGVTNNLEGEITGTYTGAVIMVDGKVYDTLAAALTAASSATDKTVTLLGNVKSTFAITIPAGVTLDGNGYEIKYTGADAITSGAFITASKGADNVTIQNVIINTDSKVKHGVQFYCNKNGKLSGVTVNGGYWTAVQVNGATGVTIENCKLNPASATINGKTESPYANIEYAMGGGVNTADQIPSLTVDNVTFTPGIPQIWVDDTTVNNMKTAMGGSPTDTEIVKKVNDSITNKNSGDITVRIELKDGNVTNSTIDGTDDDDHGGSSGGGSSVTRYTVSVEDTDNGSIRVSPTRASRGQTVTITVDPDEGYELDRLVVRDADGDRIDLERKSDTKYTFEMPRGKVTVEATFTEIEEEDAIPFRDVDTDDWFYDAVVYAYDNDLMSGVSNDQFAPDATLTRAMVAQMLYSLEGKPRTGSAGYADVAFGAWYEDAVAWISSEGLMTGYSDTAFGPDDPLTREQLALILYNYADWAGYDVRGGVSLGSYIDADSASTWAVEALEWAIDAGLISGRGEGILAPAGTATRAEVAQIFMNFLENVAQ